jgi:hypothetical protein
MIPEHLEVLTVKQLAVIARKAGILGWHGMRKAELISAIKKFFKKTARTSSKSQAVGKTGKQAKKKVVAKPISPQPKKKPATIKQKPTAVTNEKKKPPQKLEVVATPKKVSATRNKPGNATPTVKPQATPKKEQKPVVANTQPKTLPKPQSRPKHEPLVVVEDHDGPSAHRITLKERLSHSRKIGGIFEGDQPDQLALTALDPFWLRAIWELNNKLVERAKAAMGVDWHTSVPILRLYRVISDGVSRQRREHVRDVYPRGHVSKWYLDVQDPPGCFIAEIGYVSAKGRFFPLASSNTVETPDGNGFSNTGQTGNRRFELPHESERHFPFSGGQRHGREAAYEDCARRPVPTPMFARLQTGPIESVKVELEVDVVIYGKTLPDAQLTIKSEPVRLQPDGKFTFRFQLPEKRQVYPIVAVSSDGIESQTTILAIERNTKALESVFREHDEIE